MIIDIPIQIIVEFYCDLRRLNRRIKDREWGESSPEFRDSTKNICGARVGEAVRRILPGYCDAIQELQKLVGEQKDFATIVSGLSDLEAVLRSDLRITKWFVLPRDASKYFETSIVSQAIRDELPDVVFDLEEANKCIALGRYTGCAHHCMCALEPLLPRIVKKVKLLGGAFDPSATVSANWGALLNKLDAEIKKLTGMVRSKKRKNELSFLSELCLHMRSVKNAWRDPAMHARGEYNEESALRILNATNDLIALVVGMRRL